MTSKRSASPLRKRAGFTLLELSVVIAIITLLIGLLSIAVFRIWFHVDNTAEIKNWRAQRRMGTTIARKAPIRVLFIGNSYTSTNDLPAMVQALAEAAGNEPALEHDSQVVGGATLEQHWTGGAASAKIEQDDWDFVVLQEQSMMPIANSRKTYDFARELHERIKRNGQLTLFYLTWARAWAPETQVKLTNAYVTMAKDFDAEVAPVGIAFEMALKEKPSRRLHDADGSHPSPVGTYLAACVFYGTIYDKSPEGLSGNLTRDGQTLVQVSPQEARALQAIAWRAVQEAKRRLEDDYDY